MNIYLCFYLSIARDVITITEVCLYLSIFITLITHFHTHTHIEAHTHKHTCMISTQEDWRQAGTGAWPKLGGAEEGFLVRDKDLAHTQAHAHTHTLSPSSDLCSNGPSLKRLLMTFLNLSFHFNEYFQSHLFENGLYNHATVRCAFQTRHGRKPLYRRSSPKLISLRDSKFFLSFFLF